MSSKALMYAAETAQGLRVAIRRMRRSPPLPAAIVLTIALSLGAAAAIFTTSKAARIEPLQYARWNVSSSHGPSESHARSVAAPMDPLGLTRPSDWMNRARFDTSNAENSPSVLFSSSNRSKLRV